MFTLALGFGNPIELVIIAVLILVLFGTTKLKDLGKGAGEGIREFKKGLQDDNKTSPAAPSNTATNVEEKTS